MHDYLSPTIHFSPLSLTAYFPPITTQVTCEFFPVAKEPFEMTLPISPDTKWEVLEDMVASSLWSFQHLYRPTFAPSLHDADKSADGDGGSGPTVGTCLRSRTKDNDGTVYYPLLVKLRPINWAVGKGV